MSRGAYGEIRWENFLRALPVTRADRPFSDSEWVSTLGPYDEHLVRDVGELNLALGVLLADGSPESMPTVRRRAPSPTRLLIDGFPLSRE